MSGDGQALRLERVSTGVEGLDEVLGGGIPARSITVVSGEPGSGKTVLALQMLFHAARQGKRSLYFTTLGGRLDRAVSVIKARGVDVDTEVRGMTIGPRGVEVSERAPFKELRGVLTGVPVAAGKPTS